jgi:hypothetical protein
LAALDSQSACLSGNVDLIDNFNSSLDDDEHIAYAMALNLANRPFLCLAWADQEAEPQARLACQARARQQCPVAPPSAWQMPGESRALQSDRPRRHDQIDSLFGEL